MCECWGMLEAAVVDECMHCLVGAAVYEGAEADLVLVATALARDLADTQGGQAPALLSAAAYDAVAYLDASDLETEAFAAALRRLSSVRTRVAAMLVDSASYVGPLHR